MEASVFNSLKEVRDAVLKIDKDDLVNVRFISWDSDETIIDVAEFAVDGLFIKSGQFKSLARKVLSKFLGTPMTIEKVANDRGY